MGPHRDESHLWLVPDIRVVMVRATNTAAADIRGVGTVWLKDKRSLKDFDRLVQRCLERNPRKCGLGVTATTLAAISEAFRIRPKIQPWRQVEGATGRRVRVAWRDSLDIALGAVLDRRASKRTFRPLHETDHAALIAQACRVRFTWMQNDGYMATSRATPSAGARHPIDLVVVRGRNLMGNALRRKAHMFDPLTTEFCELEPRLEQLSLTAMERTQELLGTTPPAILCFFARIDRTLSRYPGGISLVYRDAGALMAVVGVVAAALGIAACPLTATLKPDAQHKLLRHGWVDVGGVAVGRCSA